MQLTNKGQGERYNYGTSTWCQWMVVGTPFGDVVYVDYVVDTRLSSTEVSTSSNLDLGLLKEVAKEHENLWSSKAPRIEKPNHLEHQYQW